MKIAVYNWSMRESVYLMLEKAGYKHKVVFESEDFFAVVKKLYEAGLAIYIPPSKRHYGVMDIFVDEISFGQR